MIGKRTVRIFFHRCMECMMYFSVANGSWFKSIHWYRICAALFLLTVACNRDSDQVMVPNQISPPISKPDDMSHLFSLTGQESIELVDDNLLGKEYFPGGNVAQYKRDGLHYQQFLIRSATPEKSTFLMMDFKNSLENARFVPHLGGYFGLDGKTPVLIIQRGHSLAGVVGLPKETADNIMREFAPRLD